MRRFLLIAIAVIIATAADISAHPLGNFSVNQFSRFEVGEGAVRVHSVLDFAEIPTFQAKPAIDTDKNGELSQTELNAYLESLSPSYLRNLELRVDGSLVPLEVMSQRITLPAGEGGLATMRMEWNLETAAAAGKIAFSNRNYTDRIGWNEVVVNAASGVQVYDSSAYATALSDELRSYPADMLASPLAERSAEFSVASGTLPQGARPLVARDGSTPAPVQGDRLTELIKVREITLSVALLGLVIAFALGASHALSPGHGKTIVGAYLVGSRGTPKHALFLGATVTVTHTLGVFALGLITLFASNYILPETLMPFISFLSGLMVFFIGATLLKSRLFALPVVAKIAGNEHSHHGHHHHSDDEHHHDDDHSHSHSHGSITHTHGGSTHTHDVPDEISWRSLLALGVSGGLLPCPSALVLMLAAISAGRTGYGLILIVAFSFGLAATLTAVGIVFLKARGLVERSGLSSSPVLRAVPVLSAVVVTVAGALICYSALRST